VGIRLCAFTGLLACSIWVTISGVLTVGLADVLGCKGAVDFTIGTLIILLYPHSHGCLWPGVLIGGDIFFFWEVGTVTSREYQFIEPRSNRIE
jgi:hypothetical protein